ncbi:MAG: hypothetical protein ABS79_05015 [Planctomycetes bacterium SCN 63-9]|nr:MAG: hypothetical protein ABS79_05015 [Planctomycetes bacterium SCN 63-9]
MRGRGQILDMFRRWDARPDAVPLAEIVDSLKLLDLDRAELAEAVGFDERIYRRVSIHRRPHYEALVLCWKSGQRSPIHNHEGSSCAVRVVEGQATETRYAMTPCNLLVPMRSESFLPGSVIGCRGCCVHQMANWEAADRDLITLHVYSPPPRCWRYFTLDETALVDHDRLIRDRGETLIADLAHHHSRGPMGIGRRVRGGMPWKT